MYLQSKVEVSFVYELGRIGSENACAFEFACIIGHNIKCSVIIVIYICVCVCVCNIHAYISVLFSSSMTSTNIPYPMTKI